MYTRGYFSVGIVVVPKDSNLKIISFINQTRGAKGRPLPPKYIIPLYYDGTHYQWIDYKEDHKDAVIESLLKEAEQVNFSDPVACARAKDTLRGGAAKPCTDPLVVLSAFAPGAAHFQYLMGLLLACGSGLGQVAHQYMVQTRWA